MENVFIYAKNKEIQLIENLEISKRIIDKNECSYENLMVVKTIRIQNLTELSVILKEKGDFEKANSLFLEAIELKKL